MDSKRALPHIETIASEEADVLVNRAGHFVEEWIEEHKCEVPAMTEAAAEELAAQCIADAERNGIQPDEINDEVGDLKEYITDTVLTVNGSGSDSPRTRRPPS